VPVIVWVKASALGTVLASGDATGTSRYFVIYIGASGVLYLETHAASGTNVIYGVTNTFGIWKQVAVVSTGTAYSIYVNGIAEALTIAGGANNGDWLADIDNRDNWSIGALSLNGSLYSKITGQLVIERVLSMPLSATSVYKLYQSERRLFGV